MLYRVRAIIIENGKVLTIKRVKKDTVYFVFPGGGVEDSESLEDAIKRECKEELGVKVKIIDIFASEKFDRDNIKQLEHFYICKIVSGELGTGDGPEYKANSDYEGTHEIEWIDINSLTNVDLRPNSIRDKIRNNVRRIKNQ